MANTTQDDLQDFICEGLGIKAGIYKGDREAEVDIIDGDEPVQLGKLMKKHGAANLSFALREAKSRGIPEEEAVKYAHGVLKRLKAKKPAEPAPEILIRKSKKWTWVMMPVALLNDRNISDGAKLFYGVLRQYAKSDGTDAFPLHSTLEEITGKERTAFARYRKELESTGWLYVTQKKCATGFKRRNVYQLTDDADDLFWWRKEE